MKTIINKKEKLEIRAAQIITLKIRQYLKTQKLVTFGIPGGRSVAGIFNLLKKQKISWHRVHIFMVDERLVPTNHPDSNFLQAEENFISYLVKQKFLPKSNVHPFNYFGFTKDKATKAYQTELREYSHRLDIVLLSSGEDGHIGALFPNHETINDNSEFFVITYASPKAPAKRITSSRKLLEKSKTAILLFFGESKRKAYENFLNREFSIFDCPAKIIQKIENSYVLTDIK